MNTFRVAVLIASLIAVKGEAQNEDQDAPVTSLASSQPAAPAYTSAYNPAQSWNPYGYQPRPNPYGGYPFGGYQQPPQMFQPQPPPMMYPQPSYGMMPAPEWGYPSANPYQPSMNIPGMSGKPNYVMNGDFTTGSVPSNTPGVVVGDTDNDTPTKPNYVQPSQPSWNNNNFNFGPPNWQQSFTPISNGCYNRCRPSCSFRPPPPMPKPMPMPVPMPYPRPRPIPLPMPAPKPMPLPQPVKPNFGCRSVCRPMCNQVPTCGGGSQFNGNTMVCGNSGFGGSAYQPPNYWGNQMMPYQNMPMAQNMPMTQNLAEEEDSSEESSE